MQISQYGFTDFVFVGIGDFDTQGFIGQEGIDCLEDHVLSFRTVDRIDFVFGAREVLEQFTADQRR